MTASGAAGTTLSSGLRGAFTRSRAISSVGICHFVELNITRNLFYDKTVEEPAQRCEMLPYGGGEWLSLDIGGDGERSDCIELQLVLIAPAYKRRCCPHVSGAPIEIANVATEKFAEMLSRFASGLGDDSRYGKSQ